MKIFQKGFNYSQDGPGNRLVYHLQGCNFRCLWCSNPEGLGVSCKKTVTMTVDEIKDEITRSKMMFFDGGGVTFTGGEATMQFDELKNLLIKLKALNINTCIETNASHKRLKELFPYLDHLIMDIKHYDSNEHQKWTGNDGNITIENFKYICKEKIPALIRIPLINNVNTNPKEFCDFLSSCKPNCQKFEVLKYHEYGKEKWETEYKMTDGFVSDNQYNEFINELKSNGFTVIRT